MKKKFKIKVAITYDLYLLADGEDADQAIDEAERQIKEHDDYVIVNRASNKSMQILDIIEVYSTPSVKSAKLNTKIKTRKK